MKSRFLIDQLISSIENSDINQIDKLKIVKVLLAIKVKLIEFSDKFSDKDTKTASILSKQGNGRPAKRTKTPKHNLVLQFIKDKGGRVNAVELLSLGIAGRSLRRYIKDLSQQNRVKIEKSGRNFFYLVV
ncbi:MAG: hypothetical protein AAB584_01880 [Patescibacteria group bacterium]